MGNRYLVQLLVISGTRWEELTVLRVELKGSCQHHQKSWTRERGRGG